MQDNSINIFMKKLRNGDYSVRPFIANKTWLFSSEDVQKYAYEETEIVDIVWGNANFNWYSLMKQWIEYLGTSSVNILINADRSTIDTGKINVFRFFYPENDKYFGNVLNISSSLYTDVSEYQPIDPKIIWYYLDHNFYKDYSKSRHSSTITDFSSNSYLSPTGSVLLFPRSYFGEGIKKGSSDFKIKNYNSISELNYEMMDDGMGNLIDASFDTSKFVDNRSNLLYVGFNEKYREYNFINKKLDYVLDYSENLNDVLVYNKKNITYLSGIPTSDGEHSTGVSAKFHGSYLEVSNNQSFNFDNNLDFAFSFWINIPATQSIETVNYNPIFNKKTLKMNEVYSSNTGIRLVDIKSISEQYPFDIVLNNRTNSSPNSISFKQSSGIEYAEVTSSVLSTDSWHHVVCQKTGSVYELWLNGVFDNSQSINLLDSVQNQYKFFIAGDGTETNYLSGSLDEIRIYNKGLTHTEIEYLSNNSYENGYAYQTAQIGNIFYDLGIITISDPRPKYDNVFLGQFGVRDYNGLTHGFEGGLKTTTRFYENEVVCRIPKNEFNNTQNNTTLKTYNKFQNVKPFTTSSLFTPYITTIGLYNDDNDLVAIAKFATPLKKRKDIDINVIIRFDM